MECNIIDIMYLIMVNNVMWKENTKIVKINDKT